MTAIRTALTVVLMVAMLVVAGCAGPVTDGADAGDGVDGADGADSATVETPVAGETGGDVGTVEFYLSDEPNAIDDFRHLNVTITKVGLHRADAEGGGEDGDDGVEGEEDDEDGEETEETEEAEETEDPGDDEEGDDGDENETATATPSNDSDSTVSQPNETATVTETAATETATTNATATATTTGTTTDDGEDGEETDEAESGGESEGDDDEREEDDGERAGWVEYEVNKTVDLTELRGANATKLDVLEAPAGSYDKVFVYVSGIEATLENGEEVNVKLPSEKLHLNKEFTVGNGQDVSFVFDIAVHEAGKSGKYILKPVVSQSGTSDEVEIEDVDEREGDGPEGESGEGADEAEAEEADENETDENETEENETDEASALSAEFVGPVRAGDDATVKVTADGPVGGATVAVDGEDVGETDARGRLTFAVPEDAEEVEVTVTKGDAEVELRREFGGGDAGGNDQGNPSLGAVTIG